MIQLIVRQLPAAEFLLSNCLPNSSLNPSLSSVNLKSRISNNNSFRIKVTIAVAQVSDVHLAVIFI